MIVEQGTSINPPDPVVSRCARITVVSHEFDDPPAPRPGGRHRAPESPWDFVDRALGSWPVTLRAAFLFLVLITGTALVVAAVGVVGQLVLAAVAFRAQRQHKRRLAELLAGE